ncbi:MAG: endonuclease III [Candidatus Omnitrophota bacterium]|nr:endonuclease III [Candidatus Omnitrophota bacterium]
MAIRDKIKNITALLNKAYGAPPAFRKDDPVDVLIRTVLSQNTTDKNSVPAFYALKRHFASWDEALGADTRKIAGVIRHAGLANIKAKRIKGALAQIAGGIDRGREGKRWEEKGFEGKGFEGKGFEEKGFEGKGFEEKDLEGKGEEEKISLGFLEEMDTDGALEYLKSLKGVGPKTAACVLLFGFGKPVMPVDTHIFRIAKRLGLIGADIGIEEAHKVLTKIVPKRLIYGFHLGIIEHGRLVCKAQTPKCGVCVVYGLCKYKDKIK